MKLTKESGDINTASVTDDSSPRKDPWGMLWRTQ